MELLENKTALIVPYFGQFPTHFPFWLESCRRNPDYDWYLYTDDRRAFAYPDNVHVTYITLEELKQRFEEKLGFETALNHAYKLCDFRPLYGFLFQEILQGYNYWGYCDVDLLFGILRHFITREDLQYYDKISLLGHLSLYRNCERINLAFKECDYRDILQDTHSRIFDEVRFTPNINSILSAQGRRIRQTIPYADIDAQYFSFGRTIYEKGSKCSFLPRRPLIIEGANGEIYGTELVDGHCVRTEYAYVHFQKRKLQIDTEPGRDFLLVPNRLIPYETVTPQLLCLYGKDDVRYTFRHKCERIKHAWKVRF